MTTPYNVVLGWSNSTTGSNAIFVKDGKIVQFIGPERTRDAVTVKSAALLLVWAIYGAAKRWWVA